VAGAAVWLFALGGAGSIGLQSHDSAPAVVLDTPTASPTPSLAALGFEQAECTFERPSGTEPECGYLTVPQVRAEPDRGRVRLPVAVFRAADDPGEDAVAYLDGGPGGNTLDGMPFIYEALKPLAGGRDLVIFDQRGAGGSSPSLDCPEVTEVNYDLLARQFTIDQRVAQDAASARQCYSRLTGEGVDPGLATSAENAADVNDLRVALGYEQWNLFGVSYGTRLALTVMRDFPEGVRSVILDSTYPPQSDLYAELQANFDRSLGVLFASCAADPVCGEAYPNLEAVFYETVDRLNEVPLQLSLSVLQGHSPSATIDGVWFSAFVFQAMYSEDLIALMPKLIFDSRNHEYALLDAFADFFFRDAESVSIGMYLSVQCGEETPFADQAAVIEAAEAHPRMRAYSEYSARSVFALCDEWRVPRAADTENGAVSSAIPTLVLAGQYDPITPPAWGALVAERLENSHYFEFPGVGHGAVFSDECPAEMASAFLDNPAQEPASGCIAGMVGIPWVVY
jgi:pimeloyl-ACP methyl ester carboxylesterase